MVAYRRSWTYFFLTHGKSSYIGGISNYFEKINTIWNNITKAATISRAPIQIQRHYDVNNHKEGNFLYEQFLDSKSSLQYGLLSTWR